MLRFLGIIYYLICVIALGLALLTMQRNQFGSGVSAMMMFMVALSSAFFGAISLVADDMRTLLFRLADRLAPVAPDHLAIAPLAPALVVEPSSPAE